MSIPVPDQTVLKRLLAERRIAGAPTPDEPAAEVHEPVAAPLITIDDEAEKRRIEQSERALCAKLQRQLSQQRMLDDMAMRQAAERRAREDFFDGCPHWRNEQ
ncbi:hypothetical protein [Paraburkholderia dipogonis]|uniref:hypothetical protein n=1 Tax=Paraburkholderia dipogonis TaxID=1211383 RepID=UPI0038BC24F6